MNRITQKLKQISPNEFPQFILLLKQEKRKELILFGPKLNISESDLVSIEQFQSCKLFYQLTGRIENLCEKLGSLVHITTLNLSGNLIGDVGAKYLSKLTQLKSLDLSRNKISEAGAKHLATLTQLTSLNLTYNLIGDAGTRHLTVLNQLTSLNLNRNLIGDAGASHLSALTQLKSLDLGANDIGDVGAEYLSALTRLKSLDLSYNLISDTGASHLSTLTELTSLDLNANDIGNAGARHLSVLSQLTSLDLSRNLIGDSGAKHLAKLTRLDKIVLVGTQITDLSPIKGLIRKGAEINLDLDDYFEAKGVYVKNCPLIHPPLELIQQGHEAVLNYFSEIEAQGIDQLFEAKMLIVGEGRAGKTSLLHRLYKPDEPLPSEDSTTKGIDIFPHRFQLSNGRKFRLNVWDFGGQQIYHATHQFFLTKRSLYILLDDTAKDHKTVHDDGFKYWLEVIEVLSDRSPVLIFQNEKGGRSKVIDEGGIKNRFPNVKDIYRGDLNDRNAAFGLSKAIEFFVQELPHIGDDVPAKWVSIRSAIEEQAQRKPYLSQQDFFDIYSQYLEFDRDKALFLSGLFHNLGVFLHFRHHPLLSRTVILQNEWATEAVFRILDDEIVKNQLGRFTRKDCERVWSESTYTNMHLELVTLMEKFELCYQLEEQTWLAPQLLPLSIPEMLKKWPSPKDLVISYRYDFLPKGLINRLMVRMNRYVKNPEYSWTSGVLFEMDNTTVLAQTADRGNEIILRARGIENKAFLSIIAGELDTLNSSFNGLGEKVHKWIPCICSVCNKSISPEFYEYQRLLKRKKDGKLEMECPESYENINVLEMLDGINIAKYQINFRKLPRDRDVISEPVERVSESKTKEIKLFLASSEELKHDRDAFELHFRRHNDHLKKQGFYLKVIRWENFLDTMSRYGLQEMYNREARNCDIFISLFMTKTGQYTEEEFNAAYKSYLQDGKPFVYTYFKNVSVSIASIKESDLQSRWRFQGRLKEMKHYWKDYEDAEHLKRLFRDQLDLLINENKIDID